MLNEMSCIICYEPLAGAIVTCPTCDNSAHRECWNMMQDKLHCPYCRNAVCDRKNVDSYIRSIIKDNIAYLWDEVFDVAYEQFKYLWKLFNATFDDCGMKSYILDIINDDSPFRQTNRQDSNIDDYIEIWKDAMENTGVAMDFPMAIEESKFEGIRRVTIETFLNGVRYEDFEDVIRRDGEFIDVRKAWDEGDDKILILLINRLHSMYHPPQFLVPIFQHCKLCGYEQPTSYIVDTETQNHRIPYTEAAEIKIYYCPHCMRAYYSRIEIFEVDPPFEEIKDLPINTAEIFNYHPILLKQLLEYKHVDERLCKILCNGQLNKLEANRQLILLSNKLKSSNMRMNIDEVFVIAKRMVIPHLLVKEHQNTIIRVLNGDDIHLLDNLFRLETVVLDNL